MSDRGDRCCVIRDDDSAPDNGQELTSGGQADISTARQEDYEPAKNEIGRRVGVKNRTEGQAQDENHRRSR